MKVTVKDCLELAAFDGARILAGRNHTGRAVKKISVLEAIEECDVTAFSGGKDQMTFTSFFGMRADEEAQCRAIRALAGNGNACLVIFHVGTVVKRISRKVINVSEQCGLPLIVMDPHLRMDMGDVITEVSEKLLMREDEFQNSLINNTIFHLLNFERYNGFPEAAKAAALSNDFQLILLSSDFNPVLSVETRHRTTIAEAIRLGKERDLDKIDSVYTMIDVNGVLTYWGPVTIQGKQHYMFIVDNEDSYSAGEITKLAEIIELAIGMWRYTPERDSRAELIKALRRGNRSLAYTMKDEAGLDPAHILSVFFGTNMDSDEGRTALDLLRSRKDFSVLEITEGNETYGLLLGEDTHAVRSSCLLQFHQLKLQEDKTPEKARSAAQMPVLFHVTGINGIEGAADAYRLIGETWFAARRIFPHKHVFSKYEMTLVSNCIGIRLQGGFLRRSYDRLLDPFLLGTHKDKQLLETLTVFVLDAGMHTGKTAERMAVHTNTVQYRLKKINDLLGADTTGNRVIPGLTIALALHRMEQE